MRLRAALVTAAVAVTALAAGTFGADSPATGPPQLSPTTFLAASYTAGELDGSAAALIAHDTTQVGPTVLNAAQHTLYRFDRDTAAPSASSCVDACAVTWPPVLVAPGSSVRLDGVAPTTVGTVARADGTVQLTLAGWPVYRYAKDRGPADLAGHGVNGTWFAVTPAGDKAADTGETTTAGAAGSARSTDVSASRPGDDVRACPTTGPAAAAGDLAATAATAGDDLMQTLFGTERDGGNGDSSDVEGDPGAGRTDRTTARSGSTSPQAGVPSDVLDLTDWYLTLPTGAEGDPDTVEQPDLGGLTNEFFLVNDTGDGVVFSAPGDGVTTKNSHFPRSELREMKGREKAEWSNTSGTHTLDVCEAITQVPSAKPEVVAAQIHGGDDDVLQIRLEGQELMVQYNDGKSKQTLDPDYELGTPYHVRIVAANSKVEVLYNGQKKADLPLSGSTWYWKVGAYVQSNTDEGDGADAAGAVTVYALNVDHNNNDDDGTGGAGAADGRASASTTGEQDRSTPADDQADDEQADEQGDDQAEDESESESESESEKESEKASEVTDRPSGAEPDDQSGDDY